jgi:hypothetical protein
MTDYEQMSHGLRPRLSVFQEITRPTLEAEEKLNSSMHSDEQLDSSNTTMDDTTSSKQTESEDENSSENELADLAQKLLGGC